jgi:hypothetical protein
VIILVEALKSPGLTHHHRSLVHGWLDVFWFDSASLRICLLLSYHHQGHNIPRSVEHLLSLFQNLGFTAVQAQLRSVPPYAVQFGSSMLVAYASDRSRRRWMFTIGMLHILLSALFVDEHVSARHIANRYCRICDAVVHSHKRSCPIWRAVLGRLW